MDKKFLEKMEKTLVTQKKALIADLISSNDDLKAVIKNEEPGDLADIAGEDIDRKMLEAKGIAELNRLKSIESAITRIKQGHYGSCIKCGKPIPKDRLEALPFALMCVECKTLDERKNA
ncbi:MAG: TraR/DksA family transcriptional regulator [Spirochaetaceae bacterium]|nr:TraR/DksA family transcriptional regulator [Spirochaetaceae bacterium]